MRDTPACTAYLRPDVLTMRPYTPGEQVNDCLKLNTNECAWPPSPQVSATLQALATDRLRLYPDPLANELRHAAATCYGCRPDQVLAGNGSDDCLTILFRSCCGAHSQVVSPWPSYGLYQTLASIQGTPLQRVPMGPDWRLPRTLWGNPAHLTLIANPNNPSATRHSVDELVDLARSLPGLLVVDEAYVDFAGPQSSLLPLLDELPNLIVLRTFSKSYSLAGARLGLLFAHEELITQFLKVKDSYNVNALTQAIGVAALGDRSYHAELVAQTLAARAELEAYCARRSWTWPASAANFLLCRVGAEAAAVYRALKQRGILVRWFDTPELREDLRISVGQPADQQRLFAALDECLG